MEFLTTTKQLSDMEFVTKEIWNYAGYFEKALIPAEVSDAIEVLKKHNSNTNCYKCGDRINIESSIKV